MTRRRIFTTSIASVYPHDVPAMNSARAEIQGVICGVRVAKVEERWIRAIRYLDKLLDDLEKGKAIGKIFRG